MSENILAPIDFSDATDAVVAKAAQLAKALDAKIWLIHAAIPEPDFVSYEVGPEYIRDSAARHLREEHKMLGQYQEKLRADGVDVTAMLVPGQAIDKILQEAQRLEAGWIVLGSHGHGSLYNLLAGSVCQGVVRKAPCAVVIVPSRPD
ncbi:MAG: universal stress protein [Phycisphaerae bacterium]|jgi:nucleotide-binding universal stress UspA family protein|nr:universal stress protein [Phycisphaerae bacterium]MDP7289586.1 universal stress protein [Phycisphaerae bacterium]